MTASGALVGSASTARPQTADQAPDLAQTLQMVADTIVESLGFEVAVINLLERPTDATMRVIAVSGPPDVRDLLLGTAQSTRGWDQLLATSEQWGRLRFLDHRDAVPDPDGVVSWIPDIPVSDDPDAWHPEDALFAPLLSRSGTPLGMLSVDVPRDGRRPGPSTLHALEAFAVTAALAIEHARLAHESQVNQQRFQAVFERSPIPIGLLGTESTFEYVNQAFCRFLRRRPEELVGASPLTYTHPEDVGLSAPASARLRHAIPWPRGGDPEPIEKRYVHPDGTVVWGRLHLTALDHDSSPGVLLAQIEDITERKRAEQLLLQQAHFDSLTRLPNRPQIMQRLEQAVDADARAGTMTAVFFCDLDGLKLVNDGHGHAVGDAYLTAIAGRLAKSVRSQDVVGRLGGDEFVVLLSGLRTPTEAIGLAGRVLEGVQQPLVLSGIAFAPTMSVGIAYGRGPATTADQLLAQADTAMYGAKSAGRGGWSVFDPTMGGSPASQLQLRHDVGLALSRGEFVLHYQPIVGLPDGLARGHEALLRWQHPRLGLLVPAQFLDVVLGSEHEAEVTDWVIRQACADTVRRPGPPGLVTVNVSSSQICREDLPAVVVAALTDSGLSPCQLVLELTEDRLLTRADGPERLEALRALGISIALDDFGSGYSGLGYLQRFPSMDIVKLDRCFIAGLGRDAVSEHLIRAMRQFTDACGLRLVAEGVETAEQAELLRELGVVYLQGYHFGRPEPFVDAR